MAQSSGWPIVRFPERVDTSSEANMGGKQASPRRARQRGRYWLVFACLPMLWGLAAAGPAGGVGRDGGASPPLYPSSRDPRDPRGDRVTAAPGSPRAAPDALPPAAQTAPEVSLAASADLADPRACVPTPLTPEALALALRAGHERRFGVAPHADRWACAWAHCAFEQAHGDAVYGNNIGHVTARSGDGRVCHRRLRERVARDPDRWELVDVWFRVFDTPEAGATAYWDLLAASYNSVLARCDDADPRGAASRLAEIGYFTGPQEPYIDGMARLFVNARGVLIPRLLATEAAR